MNSVIKFAPKIYFIDRVQEILKFFQNLLFEKKINTPPPHDHFEAPFRLHSPHKSVDFGANLAIFGEGRILGVQMGCFLCDLGIILTPFLADVFFGFFLKISFFFFIHPSFFFANESSNQIFC